MAGEFLSVPGNVKQIFLPFVLNPGNPLNNAPISVKANTGKDAKTDASASVDSKAETQLFTFRPFPYETTESLLDPKGSTGNAGLIRIVPNSFYGKQGIIARDDISYKLLYGYSGNDSIDPFEGLLNNIPRITIREYLMDAKLD